MHRAVCDQVRSGADLIKIMANHDRLEFTDAELEAVIDGAQRNGLPTTAHATNDEAIHRVAQFGIDCVEHGGSMTDETIQLLLDRNIPIVTTFSAVVCRASPISPGNTTSPSGRSPSDSEPWPIPAATTL
jgi:imidazolonepropionase-like amidohydrolase